MLRDAALLELDLLLAALGEDLILKDASPYNVQWRGALTHVVLHARLERRYGARTEVRGELRRAGFHKGLIEANARGLRKLVGRLRWEPEASPWLEYGAPT